MYLRYPYQGGVNRRDLLRLAGYGIAAGALTRVPALRADDQVSNELPQPEIRKSTGGVLATSVVIRETNLTFGGKTYPGGLTYEGHMPGVVLQVDPGDTIELDVVNAFSEITNTHFHGVHVSPAGNADNVFLQIPPQGTQHYTLAIPTDHAGGLCWFHPHMHQLAQKQLDRGLAGFLYITAPHHSQAPFADMKKKFLGLARIQYDGDGKVNPDPVTGPLIYKSANLVNGALMPNISIGSGESQYWFIGNTNGTFWFQIALDGHQFTVVAEDGNPVATTYTADKLLLTPGKRFEVIVTAKDPGEYTFRCLDYQVDGAFVDTGTELAKLVVSQTAAVSPALIPAAITPLLDLRSKPLARRRTIVLTEEGVGGGPGGPPPDGAPPPGGGFTLDDSQFKFFIDGVQFDPNVVHSTVVLGDVEEWTILNDSDSHHPFHLHVNPFMVIRRDGADVSEIHGYQDTAQANRKSSITFLVQFNDHIGRTVYHCHNVFHEDKGMMAIVEVVNG